MEASHKQNLRAIFSMDQGEFDKWVATLSEEKLTYVEWLMQQALDTLDEALLNQSDMAEAKRVIDSVQK